MLFYAGFAAFLSFASLSFIFNLCIKTKNITLASPKITKRITFILAADVHIRIWNLNYKRIIKKINDIPCDFICIAGDLAEHVLSRKKILYFLNEISKAKKVFLVSGNNDIKILNKLKNEFNENIIYLKNEIFSVNDEIKIYGVDDPHTFMDDISSFLNDGFKGYKILLAHSPDIAHRLSMFIPDLILCGHTHNGQIKLFNFIPYKNLNQTKTFFHGMYKFDETLIYITSGLGSSKIPFRFFSFNEIAVFNLIPE